MSPNARFAASVALVAVGAQIGVAQISAAKTVAKTVAIHVIHPWIAAPPNGASTAAAYADIRNDEPTSDTLLSAETPVAEALQLHTMTMTGGVMRMRQADGAVIPPGGALLMAPGGDHHLMLIRPKRPLKPGDRVPVTLTFSKAGAMKTVFVVQATRLVNP